MARWFTSDTHDHINGDNTDHRLENLRWLCLTVIARLKRLGDETRGAYRSHGVIGDGVIRREILDI